MVIIFWIVVFLLELDYEYEYFLVFRFFNKLFIYLFLDKLESREKIENV